MTRIPPLNRILILTLTLLLGVALAVPLSAKQGPDTQVHARLDLLQQEYNASEAILLRFTLENHSQSTLSVLKWGTPFEGFKADMFLITSQGVSVPYTGILMKRGNPQSEDYLTIGSGSQISVLVDLSEGYAIQEPGAYTVEYISQLLDVREGVAVFSAQGEYHPMEIATLPTSFILNGERQAPRSLASPQVFTNCTGAEQEAVNTAFYGARLMATSALSAMQNATQPTRAARYITWFGPYASTRFNTVKTHFTSISSALSGQNFDWDCHGSECGSNTFAYVYATAPYKIYLCSSFWSHGNSGTDSRPGTIIHETSHFNAVAGTDDRFYGHDNSITQAQTAPDYAVDNADSHEYFAEDVESLPMGPVTNPVRVKFSHASTEIGTNHLPYNTIGEGVTEVENGGTMEIEAGRTNETPRIDKAMTLKAVGGLVTIGQ